MDNIFELASRRKLRYASIKGDLTTEQLWELPLTSKTGFDLDTIAKAVNAELLAAPEESFVAASVNPTKANFALKLEVVKHVIAYTIQKANAAEAAVERKRERSRLIEILDKKKDEQLLALTPEQIKERIDALK